MENVRAVSRLTSFVHGRWWRWGRSRDRWAANLIENSWGLLGKGGGHGSEGLKVCPQKSQQGPLHPWGPKHRANHHMSYVYAYSCTSVMHVCENMLRSSSATRVPLHRDPWSRYHANGRHVSPVVAKYSGKHLSRISDREVALDHREFSDLVDVDWHQNERFFILPLFTVVSCSFFFFLYLVIRILISSYPWIFLLNRS